MAVTPYGFELDGVEFGIEHDITVENEGFDPGAFEWEAQEVTNPKDGHTMFGRDRLMGPTWAWQLSTNVGTEEDALAALGRLGRAWAAESIRDVPGAVLPLKYMLGGRVRRVYGRPRRFAHPPSNRIMGGYIPITCDFKRVDHLHYDDLEESINLTLASTSGGGGFRLPARMPITSLPGATREGIIGVGGDALAYPVITIYGPVTNPWVEGLDWRVDLGMSIAVGDRVTIDARPWANTVLRNGTANVSDKLGRRQWLQDIRLTPGTQEIRFGGSSSSGNPSVTVRWRNAWTTL